MRRLAFLLLIALSSEVLACENKLRPSIDDVVFDLVDPDTVELDNQLRAKYQCKYAFAMLLASNGYERMHLISRSPPGTTVDAANQPVYGVWKLAPLRPPSWGSAWPLKATIIPLQLTGNQRVSTNMRSRAVVSGFRKNDSVGTR